MQLSTSESPAERVNVDPLPAISDVFAAFPAPGSTATATNATLLAAVEQQLARYLAAMTARAEEVQRTADNRTDEIGRHFQEQVDALRVLATIKRSSDISPAIRAELRAEIETEIRAGLGTELQTLLQTELANSPSRAELSPSFRSELRAELRTELQTELRNSMQAELRSELRADVRSEILAEREKVGQRLNQFAAQSSALTQQVADSTTALNQRLDETGRALEDQIDERSVTFNRNLTQAFEAASATATDHIAMVARKADENDQRSVDRMLAMEERINEHAGTRLADLDATMGRLSRGMDEAIGAMSHRLAELESTNIGFAEHLDRLALDVSKVDQDALDRLSEQMSSAVGESMLVRIEMERLGVSTSEQVDRVNVRIGELAAQVADTTMDVTTAVQLERLEEIERALIELDPAQFVRKGEYDGSPLPMLDFAAHRRDLGEVPPTSQDHDAFEGIMSTNGMHHEPSVAEMQTDEGSASRTPVAQLSAAARAFAEVTVPAEPTFEQMPAPMPEPVAAAAAPTAMPAPKHMPLPVPTWMEEPTAAPVADAATGPADLGDPITTPPLPAQPLTLHPFLPTSTTANSAEEYDSESNLSSW